MKRKEFGNLNTESCQILQTSSIKTKIIELKTGQKIVQKDYATEKMLLIVLKAPSTV